MILALGFSRAMRRIVCRAPWSAVAVTEQVLTTITSASLEATSTPPAARRSSSMRSESAWLTRQPNVTIEYFMFTPRDSAARTPPHALSLARRAALVRLHNPGQRPTPRGASRAELASVVTALLSAGEFRGGSFYFVGQLLLVLVELLPDRLVGDADNLRRQD